ncbi:tRNA/rRNA methyltransferase [Granulicella aggregans]|uniref:tRNA/rRNA methyltransferase n=1 Tax=Granulicella aggregans TaxID=474949 RepID=A0A7W8E3S7_9BACT|nr:TrmH family RNA methyltransferase [Granulicella aggregans]MBB5058293.1 tRNA/rRNA methyltransferase [Granulicella aggregans]
MLSSEHLARVAVVLVRARNPKNIGAVARAMHDFGFSDLRIVNEFVMPLEGARSAVDASSVLHAATTYATVAEAVADCVLVAGTTAVGERVLEHPLFAINDAPPRMIEALEQVPVEGSESKVAILFGSEKTGLSNEELSHCNWLTTIPMFQHAEQRHLSMNLGQAVAVCLYELVRERPLTRAPEAADAASSAEQERVLGLLSEVLEAADYLRHHPARSAPADLRRLILRMKMSRVDAPVWMGMLRQILWKLRN